MAIQIRSDPTSACAEIILSQMNFEIGDDIEISMEFGRISIVKQPKK